MLLKSALSKREIAGRVVDLLLDGANNASVRVFLAEDGSAVLTRRGFSCLELPENCVFDLAEVSRAEVQALATKQLSPGRDWWAEQRENWMRVVAGMIPDSVIDVRDTSLHGVEFDAG